jgi:hypothetical protein
MPLVAWVPTKIIIAGRKADRSFRTAHLWYAEDEKHRRDANHPAYFDVHGSVLQRDEERGSVLTPPQRLVVRRGRRVCTTHAARQSTVQALASVRRTTVLHAIIAQVYGPKAEGFLKEKPRAGPLLHWYNRAHCSVWS